MNACRDLDLDYVVVYTEADKDSEHVRQNITSGPDQNAWRITSYTEPNDIFAVADHTGCTAIHPGYGFFSEDFRFARRATIRDRALTFIGPNWEVIRDLGDKINTKRVANKLGIPTIPGTDAPIYNEMEAEEIAAGLLDDQRQAGVENPSILVKAAAGGGGMGIEEVTEIEQFRRVYRQLQNYAKRQFGDGGVLIEQCLRDYNHLEVQLVCSRYGERIHFSSRNCTIQSTGRQKRVEAAPGFHDSCFEYDFDEKKLLDQIVKYSLKLADYVKYDNVGTWEWIISRSGQPYLLEVNTRIQVENDISARISYIGGEQPNLIREQIRLGLGNRIGYKQSAVKFKGAAIELRIVAEDTRPRLCSMDRHDNRIQISRSPVVSCLFACSQATGRIPSPVILTQIWPLLLSGEIRWMTPRRKPPVLLMKPLSAAKIHTISRLSPISNTLKTIWIACWLFSDLEILFPFFGKRIS